MNVGSNADLNSNLDRPTRSKKKQSASEESNFVVDLNSVESKLIKNLINRVIRLMRSSKFDWGVSNNLLIPYLLEPDTKPNKHKQGSQPCSFESRGLKIIFFVAG